jgi:probable HAF family extracellular repeat protein
MSTSAAINTVVSFTMDGSISDGTAATIDFVINGTDYGTKTLSNVPGGYVDPDGVSWDGNQTFTFTLSGLVPISQIKLSIQSPVVTVNGENSSQVYISSASVDGVGLSAVTYTPLTGSVLNFTLTNGSLYDGGSATIDTTPWNAVLSSQTWSSLSDLGALNDSSLVEEGLPVAINEAGDAVFSVYSASNNQTAFTLENGSQTALSDLGGGFASAVGINNTGQIVGTSENAAGQFQAVLWQNASISALGDFGGGESHATSINDAGQIVGYATTSANLQQAFLWQNGKLTDLGDLGGGESFATGINDAGQIVGFSITASGAQEGFLWQNGTMAALGDLGGGSSQANAINASGEIAGWAVTTSGARQAVMWLSGKTIDLGDLGGGQSEADAINSAGQVVGFAYTASGSQDAFLWVNGKGMVDLNSLVPSGSGWELIDATGINDNGQIVGFGTYDNNPHGFELTLGSGLTPTDFTASAALSDFQQGGFLTPAAITDSAANIQTSLDGLQSLAKDGDLGSITLTDSGTPALSITAAQLSADTAVLDDISGSYTLTVAAGTSAASIVGIAGHATTVTFSGDAGQYTIGTADGAVTITDGGVTDTLSNISAIQFADVTEIVAAPPGPAGAVTTGNVTELYAAVLDREPDLSGLTFYQDYLQKNPTTPLQTFAEFFLSSTEYTSEHNYAQNSAGDMQFIEDSYQNLLHRTPSSSEVAFYEDKVLAPAVANQTPGTTAYASAQLQAHALMLVYFSASTEFLGDVEVTAANPPSAQHWLVLT